MCATSRLSSRRCCDRCVEHSVHALTTVGSAHWHHCSCKFDTHYLACLCCAVQEQQNLGTYGPGDRGAGGGGYGSYREPEQPPRYSRPHDPYGSSYLDDPYGAPPARMPPPGHLPPHPGPAPHHMVPAPVMHAPPPPHSQVPQVLVISPDQLQQPISTASVQALLPQILAALQQQQQQPQQQQQVTYAPPAAVPPPQPQVAPVSSKAAPEPAASLGPRLTCG